MAGKGGKTEGAGRKPKADEEKTNTIFLTAIKQLKNVETDDEARIALAKDLLEFDRGKIFISEHLFGKPKETSEITHNVNDFDIKEIFTIDKSKP